MRGLLAFLAAALVVWPASVMAQSVGIGNTITKGSGAGYVVRLDSSKAAGTYVIGEAFPKAVVGFELGSAFVGTLYACETTTYAAATCTALPSTLNADLVNTTFDTTRGWYLLTISTAESGSNVSYLRIYGGYEVGGGGGAINSPFDSDGDGILDTITVRGDYNGDGAVTPEDIDAASDYLFAQAGSAPKTVLVQGGPYSMSGVTFDWGSAERGFIELNTNTTLACAPGTIIEGFGTAAEYSSALTTQVISHKTATSSDITIAGCTISSPVFQAPYDASGWNNENHFAIHMNGVTNLKVIGNTVLGAGHTCIYARDSVNAEIRNNTFRYCGGMMEHGGDVSTISGAVAAKALTIALQTGDCTSWTCAAGDAIVLELDDGTWHQADVISVSTDTLGIRPVPPTAASSGNAIFRVDSTSRNNGIYLFSQSNDTVGGRVVGNVGSFVGGIALHARANDNTVVARNVDFSGNSVSDTVGECFDVAGIRGGTFSGNTCSFTQGLVLVDDSAGGTNFCFDNSPDPNCSDGVAITNNTLLKSRYDSPDAAGGAVRWGRGHSNVTFTGNTIDGTIDGNCWAQFGNSPGSIIDGNVLSNCGGDGWFDVGLQAITMPLAFTNLRISNVGMSNIQDRASDGIRIGLGHTGLSFDNLVVEGCGNNCFRGSGSGATSNLSVSNFVFDGTFPGFIGSMTESAAQAFTCDADTENRWILTTDATDATDCTYASGTGSTANACYCTGSAWTDYGSPFPAKDVVDMALSGNQTNMSFKNGIIKNPSSSRDGLRIQGAGTHTNTTIENVTFSMGGPAIPSGISMDDGLIFDATTVTGALVRGVVCGQNVTDCIDASLDDVELGAFSFVTDAQTPDTNAACTGSGTPYACCTGSGTGTCVCSGGSVMVDSDGAAGANLYVCTGAGAWDVMP